MKRDRGAGRATKQSGNVITPLMICGLIEQAAVILRTLSGRTVDVTLTHVQPLQTE